MDTGNGCFEMGKTVQKLEEKARGMAGHGGIFTVGEEVELSAPIHY